jgi:Flp pilus assembly pilin Flp
MVHKLANACGARSEAGVVAIQYALLASMVALVIIPAAGWISDNLAAIFMTIANALGG